MPPKLTIDVINHRIGSDGYKALEYDVKTKKFTYLCPEGHKGATRLDHWNRGVRCRTCAGNKKHTFKDLEKLFSKEGYKVISTKYTNCKTPVKYTCPKGHTHEMTYNNFSSGYRCPTCFVKSINGKNNPYVTSGAYLKSQGKNSPHWKGGVSGKNLPLYDTYAPRLEKYHKVHLVAQNGLDLLGVECTYCSKTYVPKLSNVVNRLQNIEGVSTASNDFYCSEECKKLCPNFAQKKYPKGKKPYILSREVQAQLRELRLAIDNTECQLCFTKENLQCHHYDGVELNPIESADVDRCVTLCKKCHKELHKIPGYTYQDFKRRPCTALLIN